MKSLIRLLFLFSFLILSCSKETKKENLAFFIEDDLGNRLEFSQSPAKVISLAPNLTEIIFALNCGDKLIGSTIYCNYPEDAAKTEKVGDLINVNLEKIYSLKPDIVFMTVEGNSKAAYENLSRLNIKVFVSNPRNFDGIVKTIRNIGKILNCEKNSLILSNKINAIRDSLKEVNSNSTKKNALFLISLNPLIAAGKNTFINEIISLANFENIIKEENSNYPLLSREEVFTLNPDFIIMPKEFAEEKKFLLNYYPEWKNLKAYKDNNLIFVEQDIYFRPGPRAILAALDLREKALSFVKK